MNKKFTTFFLFGLFTFFGLVSAFANEITDTQIVKIKCWTNGAGFCRIYLNKTIPPGPCGTVNDHVMLVTSNIQFATLNPGGKEVLSLLIAAKTQGMAVSITLGSTCVITNTVRDIQAVSY